MTKTLKDFMEVYKPKSPDEQKFVDKHVTIKHSDRNGNGDDVFKATNIKTIKRKEDRKGYDPGEDEKVYEEVEDVEEARVWHGDYNATSEPSQFGGHRPKVVHKEKGHTMYLGQHGYKKPEMARKHAEAYLTAYSNVGPRAAENASLDFARANKKHMYKEEVDIEAVLDEALDLLMSIDEKTLTPAEMKKREEVVKAIKRDDPKMDKSMAYAIATKTAKRVAEGTMPTADEPTEHDKKMAQKVRDLLAKEKKPVKEEAEEIDEISKATMGRYINRAKDQIDTASYRQGHRDSRGSGGDPVSKGIERKLSKRHGGIELAVKKLTKEEAEDLDESAKIADHLIKRYGDNVRKSHVRSAANDFGVGYVALSHAVRKKLKVNRLEEEQIDEISAKKLTDYTAKASDARGHRDMPTAKLDKRYKSMALAHEKIRQRHAKVGATNEEVEELDELSNKTLSSYAKKATNQAFGKGVAGGAALASSDKETEAQGHKLVNKAAKRMIGAQKAIGKLTKEDIINRSIEKYVPEELKFTPEERLLKRLEGLSEGHVNTLLGLFEALNKDNQNRMIETVETREGINQLLNFALENRGE